MAPRFHPAFLLMVILTVLAGCSGKGPDVTDPNSDSRTETALMLMENGSTMRLARYSEQADTLTGDGYGGDLLGMYAYDDAVYLHRNDSGRIDVLDLRTRAYRATISGFPFGIGGGLTNMAFSNASQGWAVAYGSLNLYHIDLRNNVIADEIPLPANPTNVGTNVRNVFVGMQESDGSGSLAIFRSNPGGDFTIEKTLHFPSPVIYSMASVDSLQFVVLTAGGPGEAKPKVYAISMANLEVVDQFEIEAPPLTSYIGKQPTFATHTRDELIYLSIPSAVLQINILGQSSFEWILGSYPVIGADYFSGLLYAYDSGVNVIRRRDAAGAEFPDLSVSSPVHDIDFVPSSRVE